MKRGTPRHPKVYDLMQELGLSIRSKATAIGYLELLWHFTAEFAPQGDIGRYSDDRIEAALEWYGKRGRLIQSLTTSGWCELHNQCRIIVHDWHDHADDSTRRKLQRLGLQFVTVTDKVTEKLRHGEPKTPDSVRTALALPKPVPEPEPLPTPRASEFPKTDAAVRRLFPTADMMLVLKIVQASVQAFISVDHPKCEQPSDGDIADAVDVAFLSSKNQHSAALFTTTVPQVIRSWAQLGRQAIAHKNGKSSFVDDVAEVIGNKLVQGRDPW